MTYIKTKTYTKTITKEIDPVKDLASFMHKEYEKLAKKNKWDTQKKTKVSFEKLPIENKKTMLEVAEKVLLYLRKQGVRGYDDFHGCICIPIEVFGEEK